MRNEIWILVYVRGLGHSTEHTFMQLLPKGSLEKPHTPSSWFSLNLSALRFVRSNYSQCTVGKVYLSIALSCEDR